MNILFLSLTRFGDLLQSQAAITDVSQEGHQVGIACLQNFLPAVHLMKHVDHAFPFIGSSLLTSILPQKHQRTEEMPEHVSLDWLNGIKELVEWRDMVWDEFAPDVVINLSPYISSCYLTRFMAKNALIGGFTIDDSGQMQTQGFWGNILLGPSKVRGLMPYNITDIFRGITAEALEQLAIEQGLPLGQRAFLKTRGAYGDAFLQMPTASIIDNAQNGLNRGLLAMGLMQPKKTAEGRKPSDIQGLIQSARSYQVTGFVGIQLGASVPERQWPVEYYAKVGEYLWENYKLCPVLLGTQNEIPLAEQYTTYTKSPAIPLCGKTGLVDLSAILSRCLFLLTNDTGTMHLAAGLEIPSFGMFLATAQPFDTGPYLENCFCFEPDMDCHPCGFTTPCAFDNACLQSIQPEAVIECIDAYIHERVINSASLGTARVWRSQIDDKGALSLEALHTCDESSQGENCSSLYVSSRGEWLPVYRQFVWLLMQGINRVDQKEAMSKILVDAISTCNEGAPTKFSACIQDEAMRLAEQLTVLEQQGEVLLLRPVALMQQRFLESWEQINTLLSASPWFVGIQPLWVHFTQSTERSFEDIMQGIGVFRQVIRQLGTSYKGEGAM